MDDFGGTPMTLGKHHLCPDPFWSLQIPMSWFRRTSKTYCTYPNVCSLIRQSLTHLSCSSVFMGGIVLTSLHARFAWGDCLFSQSETLHGWYDWAIYWGSFVFWLAEATPSYPDSFRYWSMHYVCFPYGSKSIMTPVDICVSYNIYIYICFIYC